MYIFDFLHKYIIVKKGGFDGKKKKERGGRKSNSGF